VDEAVDRVGVDQVTAGLAEAAMSSYRLAHKMHADFVYADRKLAVKVHEIYGDDVIHLARHFLRDRKVTAPGLLCDVVLCAGGVPTAVAESTSQVVVHAPHSVSVPASLTGGASPLPSLKPVPEPSSPPSATSPSGTPKSEELSSTVQGTLTSLDYKAISRNMPRGARPEEPLVIPKGTSDQASELLTPAEWRQAFEHLYLSQNRG
jgi:hypothetical protein